MACSGMISSEFMNVPAFSIREDLSRLTGPLRSAILKSRFRYSSGLGSGA